MPSFEVTFPGGKKVLSHQKGFEILTDQPVKVGGEGSAPAPFDLFMASIATCAGYYALEFCSKRELSTEGMKVDVEYSKNDETNLIDRISIKLHLPKDFPEKYEKSIIRSMDLCSVKKHLMTPPSIETEAIFCNN